MVHASEQQSATPQTGEAAAQTRLVVWLCGSAGKFMSVHPLLNCTVLQSYWPVAQTTHCCWSAEWRNSTVHHAGCKSFDLLYRARKDRSITHTEAVATHQCLSWLLANCLRLLASTECASVCREAALPDSVRCVPPLTLPASLSLLFLH